MMVSMLSVGFVSCGDDDDDESNFSGSGVVGTWSGSDDDGEYLTVTFKKDGTGTWISRYYDSYSGSETKKGSFSYEMEGNSKGVITVKNYDSYYGYEVEHTFFEIEGKRMYLYDDYYGEDLECILTKE